MRTAAEILDLVVRIGKCGIVGSAPEIFLTECAGGTTGQPCCQPCRQCERGESELCRLKHYHPLTFPACPRGRRGLHRPIIPSSSTSSSSTIASSSSRGAGGQSVTRPWQFATAASSCARSTALLDVGLLGALAGNSRRYLCSS